jgi:Raf kinase inhibitor-like YbhB/YbcL family protein
MKITSQAFKEGGKIPDKYTKYGENRIPPIHLEGVPEKAKSLALIVDDPDAPNGTFNHWLLFNLDPNTKDIKEDAVPVMATQGRNDFGEVEYDGPKPPSGEHRYFFRAFALDTVLPLSRGIKRQELEKEMQNHVVEQAALMGRYGRSGRPLVQGRE